MEFELIEDAGLVLVMLAGVVVVLVGFERILEGIAKLWWIFEASV
jgi:hypothetical protein